MRQCIILTRRNVGTLLRIRKFLKFKVEENGKKNDKNEMVKKYGVVHQLYMIV